MAESAADSLDAQAGEALADCGVDERGFDFGLYPGEHVLGGLGGGEPAGGGGFYEVKLFDPDGVVFDITGNGWTGSAND